MIILKYKYFIIIYIILILLILAIYLFKLKNINSKLNKYENYQNSLDIKSITNNNIEIKSMSNDSIDNYILYCFWTGDNELTKNRTTCLQNIITVSQCNVILINKDILNKLILNEHPLHPAYEYLSSTHKADYLRTYFMNFYGGGYTDIKKSKESWRKSFDDLKNSDYWICGYKELKGGVAYYPNEDKWKELIGNGAYICKPQTPLTKEWYNEMLLLLDTKLEKLKLNPAKGPQDCAPYGNGYPIEWNEMLGRIFHKVSYKYKDKILNTLPEILFDNYR